MIGNVTGNDTGNVSRTCKHIIAEKIKLVNTNLVEVRFDTYRVRLYVYFEQNGTHNRRNNVIKDHTENSIGFKKGSISRKTDSSFCRKVTLNAGVG